MGLRPTSSRPEVARDLAPLVERHAFGQLLAHREHARVRRAAGALGLALFGDLQVGYSDADAWAYRAAFLAGYRMGAPPSRTNPEGQPWGYPVLDPDQLAGRAGALVRARAHHAFRAYDGLRIDHPHGLVCPWVYRSETGDDGVAVRGGARLHESPDLPDHPQLARYALVRPDQIDRDVPRHADHWVTALEPAQIELYARLLDLVAEEARRHGRDTRDLSCEVLSTMPAPLGAVLARHGLGRWRVSEKANLDDPDDVYRMHHAAPADWVMLGNHDTPPIFALVRAWPPSTREAWARHLATRLALARPERLAQPGFLANAMLAELFASRAENVSIFFARSVRVRGALQPPGRDRSRRELVAPAAAGLRRAPPRSARARCRARPRARAGSRARRARDVRRLTSHDHLRRLRRLRRAVSTAHARHRL